MRPKLKPDIDPEKLTTNPFICSPDFQISIRTFKEETDVVSLKNIEGGIITNLPNKLTLGKVVEQEKHCKIYTRAGYRLHIMSLSSRAKDLFLWITYELDLDQDWLWINKDRYMKEVGVSLNTYKGAIEDLTTGVVITPTLYRDTYWINPIFIFSGSRIRKYPTKLSVVI